MATNKIITIANPEGLRARSAALFVATACRFESQILVEVENKKINAKSIMGVLSLGVTEGDKIHVFANGSDECEAIEALSNLSEAED